MAADHGDKRDKHDEDRITPPVSPFSSQLRLSTLARSSSQLGKSFRSASSQALDQLTQLPARLPKERTSFIRNATEENRRREIIIQSLKKGSFLFVCTHGIFSGARLALALLAKRRAARRGETRPFLQILKQVLGDANTRRLATFVALYSSLWTLAFPALRRSGRRYDPETGELIAKDVTFASRWAPSIAGAIAGLALLAQNTQERINLAPNLLCRGLYSLLKHRPLFHLPHGDIWLFGLSNAQIISAFAMNPQTLPAWYWHWIRRTGTLDTEWMSLNRQLNRGSLPDMKLPELLISRTEPIRAPFNQTRLEEWLTSPSPLAYPGAPCHLAHADYEVCEAAILKKSFSAFQQMAPTYFILHAVPALVFGGKLAVKNPLGFLTRMARKTTLSSLFLSTFVFLVCHGICFPSRLYEATGIKVRGSTWYGLIGSSTAAALLWEDPRRRGELALYCAPKALASVWSVAEGKKWVRSPPFGEMLVACAGTALLMHCFVHGPEKMPSLARGVISQVVDPHFPGRSPSKAKLVTGTDTPIAIHRSPQGTPAELDGEPALQIRVPGGKGKPKFRV